MGLGERLIALIERRRERLRLSAPGPLGDFYRRGGNSLLYEVPATTGGVVIDAGGYEGQWTSRMLALYGCRSIIFEPIPAFAEHCARLFSRNALVTVRPEALGGSDRLADFALEADGSSEFGAGTPAKTISARVADIAAVIGDQTIDCLKLNIEGGEYEVLERLIETGLVTQCRSILVQFHPQPQGWEPRREAIDSSLRGTHVLEWGYPLVWEKWVSSSISAA